MNKKQRAAKKEQQQNLPAFKADRNGNEEEDPDVVIQQQN